MQSMGNLLAEFEPPPFDDPNYVKRCNASWRAEYLAEIDRLRKRWKAIIAACLAGEYGRHVRDEWQSSYPGINPETLGDLALMQAAQAVWEFRGSKSIEKMPMQKTVTGHVCPSDAKPRVAPPEARQLPVYPSDERDERADWQEYEQSSFAGMV
jgi:hypothetical protein